LKRIYDGESLDPERAEDSIRLDEIALHVHQDQGGVGRIDEFRELGEYVLAFNSDHLQSFAIF
jgi:hypothetical protein